MSRKVTWKQWVSILIAFAFVVGSIAGMGNQKAEAAARKTIRSVKIMQGRKNVTKKTLKMRAGTTKKLVVKAKTTISKKKIKFRSSNKKVVTVSKKGFKTRKTWVKVSVKKADKAPVTPITTPDVMESPAPTGTPDVTETPAPTGTPDVAETPIPTESPDVPKEPNGNDSGKLLVAYFSWSGTSERIAQNIISQTGADSFRIERATPYSDDYNTVAYGEAKDEADNNARPPLKAPLESVAAYDKIVLCYPIWWHTAPMTVGTFLESYDLTGKMIYPISQSASMNTSQYEQSVTFVKECAKGATVDDGLFTKDNETIREYVENTVLK